MESDLGAGFHPSLSPAGESHRAGGSALGRYIGDVPAIMDRPIELFGLPEPSPGAVEMDDTNLRCRSKDADQIIMKAEFDAPRHLQLGAIAHDADRIRREVGISQQGHPRHFGYLRHALQ